MNVIFSSCGNDSVALIQYAINFGLEDITVAYSDTQWGSVEWPARVELVKDYCESSGIIFHTIKPQEENHRCGLRVSQGHPRHVHGTAFCLNNIFPCYILRSPALRLKL